MPSLRIRVLGQVGLTVDSRPRELAPKPEEALCLLLSRGSAVTSDDWLCQALWHGAPPASSAAALRVHLTRVRSALEPDREVRASSRIARTPGGWRLRLEPEEVDAYRFEVSAASAASAAVGGDAWQAWESSELALAEWGGSPFPGLDLDPLVAEGLRLNGLHRATQLVRWRAGLTTGRASNILPEILVASEDDPYDSGLVELAAWANVLAGRQREALDVVRRHRRQLADDLGLEASPHLRELETRILRHEETPQPAQRRRPPPDHGNLIGRADLLRAVLGALGGAQMVQLRGAPGVGKTSILRVVAPAGRRVLRARCTPAGSPLRAVIDLLASGRDLVADLDGLRTLRRAAEGNEAGVLDASSMALLAEDLMSELTASCPVLLVLDDADHLDPASARVLARAASETSQAQVLIALRTGAPAPDIGRPPLVIDVPPIDDRAASELLARLRARSGHQRLSDRDVLDAAGGNPWLLEALTIGGPEESLVGRLLGGVGSEANEAAVVAALMGPIRIPIAEKIMGEESLEQLLVARILVLDGGAVSVRHDMVAAAIRREAGPMACARTAARLVREAPAHGLLPLELTLAVDTAGVLLEPFELAHWALAAGRQALAAGGVEQARRLFERASEVPAGPEVVGPARSGLAAALAAAGDVAGGREGYVRAFEPLQAAGLDEELAESLVSFVGILSPDDADAGLVEGIARWLLERDRLSPRSLLAVVDARAAAAFELGASVIEASERLVSTTAGSAAPIAGLYRSLGLWRRELHGGSSQGILLGHATAVADQARRLDEPALLVRGLRIRLDHLIGSGRPAEAAQCLDELEAVARSSRSAQGRWWADVMRAAEAIRHGDLPTGASRARAAYQTWDRLPEPPRAEALRLQLLAVAYLSGDHGPLLDALADARVTAAANEGPLERAAGLAVAVEAGMVSSSEPVHALVADLADTGGAAWVRPAAMYFAGRALLHLGEGEDRLLTELEPHSGTVVLLGTAAATAGPVDTVLAGLSIRRGDPDRGRYLGERARGLAEAMGSAFWAADVDRVLAWASPIPPD